jgi:hypothetical protein
VFEEATPEERVEILRVVPAPVRFLLRGRHVELHELLDGAGLEPGEQVLAAAVILFQVDFLPRVLHARPGLGLLDVIEDPLPRHLAPARVLEIEIDDHLEAGRQDPVDGPVVRLRRRVAAQEPPDDGGVEPREADPIGPGRDRRLDGLAVDRLEEQRATALRVGGRERRCRRPRPRRDLARARAGARGVFAHALPCGLRICRKVGVVHHGRVEVARGLGMRRPDGVDELELLLHLPEERDRDDRPVQDEGIKRFDGGLRFRRPAR